MPNPKASHDPASCARCEVVPPEGYRRHWKHEPKAGSWHTIADGPDVMARLPRQAHYLTALSYHLGPDLTPANYRGPFYGEFDAEDPADAFADLRSCLELLRTEYDCSLEAIHVYHLGSRGPHWTLAPAVIGAEAGHPQLPRIYAAMAQHLFPPQMAPTLDRSVYCEGMGRMWRLPNRQRSDNRRHKIPLSMREVLHKPYAHLEALTVRPRRGLFWPADEELLPCPALVQLYRDTVAATEHTSTLLSHRNYKGIQSSGDVTLLLDRCAFICHCQDHAVTLTEPEWFAMISNVVRCVDGPIAVHQLSAPYPSYSPQETDAKITHALQDTGPHTCAFIHGLGFQGCPSGGCGVRAPIGLAQPSDSGNRHERPRFYQGYRGLRYTRPVNDSQLGSHQQHHGVPPAIASDAGGE